MVRQLSVLLAISIALGCNSALAADKDNGGMPKALLEQYYQGVSFFKKGDLDNALSAFKGLALNCPQDPLVHLSLAAVLHQHGDVDDAIAEYRRAISLRPYDAFARESLGSLLQSQGEMDEAIQQYEEAIKLRPDIPLFYLNLGIAHRIQGNLDNGTAGGTRR